MPRVPRQPALLALALLTPVTLAASPAGALPVQDAGGQTDAAAARELLEAAAAAAGELRSGLYQARAQVTTARGDVGAASGEVRFTKLDEPAGDLLGAQLFLRAKAPDASGAEVPFELAYDGELVRGRIGEEPIQWSSAPGDAGLELLEVGVQLLMDPLYAAAPYAEALASAELSLGAEVQVGDVACREVVVQHGPLQRHERITYAFALDDHLPRRRVAEVHHRGVAQTQTLELTSLRKNPGIHPSVYRPRPPAGYQQQAFVSRRAEADVLAVGTEVPELELNDTEGGVFRLSEQRGKVVVLDFWSTWTVPCRTTMPLVERVHKRFEGDPRVVFYGIATQERPGSDPAAYMAELGATYGLLLGGERVAPSFRVSALPTLYAIGTDGRVLYAKAGLEPALEALLGKVIDDHLAGEAGR